MTAKIILGTGPIDPIAADILAPFGEIVIAPDSSEDALFPFLDRAVALVVRGDGKAGRRVIENAPLLEVIGRSGIGYNNVDIEAATMRGIPVVITPGAGARAVAEGAVTFMLALCKKLSHLDAQMKAGNWRSRFDTVCGDLDGAVLGIIGFGNIGQALAAMATPFNMSVLAYDPYANADRAAELGVKLVELDQLLRESDFISIHAPLTNETRNLINRDALAMMKPGAYLVNMARGGLIDGLDILWEALESGKLAGVGLDVFEPEPPDVNHQLFAHPNCLTTPHALGMSARGMARIFKSMADDMAAVLSGKRPRHVVNPEVVK